MLPREDNYQRGNEGWNTFCNQVYKAIVFRHGVGGFFLIESDKLPDEWIELKQDDTHINKG